MAQHIHDKVRIYEIVDPDLLGEHAGRLQLIFMSCMGITREEQITFSIDPYSGWIYCIDKERLFTADNAARRFSLAPEARDARRAADEFLRVLRNELNDPRRHPFLKVINAPNIVPPQMQFADLQPVIHPESDVIDHWVCRYTVTLPLYGHGHDKALVMGAVVEVRVGRELRIVGYNAHWSPITGTARAVAMVPPFTEEHEDDDHEEHEEDDHEEHEEGGHEEDLVIVYAMDNVRSTLMAPYYYILSGHHGGLSPASTHSLLIDIAWVPTLTGARVGPMVAGGSGSYRFEWFSWRPDTIFSDDGITAHGEDAIINVGPGVYNMTVVVHDREFGIRSEFSKSLYISIPDPSFSTTNPNA